MLHNHPSGHLEPSDADMDVAAQLYEQGLGTAILDNLAERLYVVVEPPRPRPRVPLELGELESVLAPGGALSDRYGAYEDRPGQREMLAEVVGRFNDGGVAIVEAGTGTGKSLAYLIPAARWAQENGERTVISTNTINLQEQLAHKDLPLVRDLVGDVRWTLVKGRGNYVSIRRALVAAESQATLFEDDRSSEIAGLLEWMEATEDGSLSDLPFTPSEDTWEEVRSDPDICLRSRCPHFQECFYQQSRRKAASAELLVVNHHLLFTDLAVRRATQNYTQSAVLPAYQRVILDEAHNLEDAATSHLGVEVTRRGLYRTLSRLDRRGRGILAAVHEGVAGHADGPEIRERAENRVRPALARARAALDGFLDLLEPVARPAEGAVRLGASGVGEPAEATAVGEALAACLATLGSLEREIAELRARLEILDGLPEGLEARVLDLRSIERRVAASGQGLRLVLAPGDQESAYVRWLDSRGRGPQSNLVLGAAPIELGTVLRESLFTHTEAAVLTSATLSTRRRFDFLRGRSGSERAGAQRDRSATRGGGAYRVVAIRLQHADLTLCANRLCRPPSAAMPTSRRPRQGWFRSSPRSAGEGSSCSSRRTPRSGRVADLLREAGAQGRWPLHVQGEEDRVATASALRGRAPRHPAGDVVLLGGRGRARRSAEGPRHPEAPVPRADRADHGGAHGGHRDGPAAIRSRASCFHTRRSG